jgi:seryl-tRNA synthetase
VVKNERNKYVNLIQSSSQALAEMKEKIRILNNELEILRNEGVSKDKALSKEKLAHQQALNQRDGLRQEMNKLLSEYRQKQSIVEQQIQEIDKLNLVINNLEQQMLDLKSRYERYVEVCICVYVYICIYMYIYMLYIYVYIYVYICRCI